jgi:tetratricopeptide (TPR) repeat protein
MADEPVPNSEIEKDPKTGDQYNLSGDFRGAVVNIQSTIVSSDVVKDIEDLPPEPGESPFLGLQYFDEKDADLFFGRELLTARVVNRLNHTRFLTVIGASGSGKSSLVRAGVIPALKRGERLVDGSLPLTSKQRWQFKILTPTAHPLESLAAKLLPPDASLAALDELQSELAANPRALVAAVRRTLAQSDAAHLLLVIDQFEEIYTLCRHPEERFSLIENLLAAADPQDHLPVTILLTLRADFYAQLAEHDRLREMVSQNQEFIGAMSRDELFRAILKPAELGKWKVQEGLVEVMLHDAGSEPGALPLLSHALLETWKRRRGRTLTLSGYTEVGGVRGAIAETAEAVFQSRLTPEQRPIARMIFIRLAELGKESPDTRRRASFSELITAAVDERTIQLVINILTDSRLITATTIPPNNEQVVEVAHEALIREWPTLRDWLNENRKDLILHRELTADTSDWVKLERDPGVLYRGGRLKQIEDWLAGFSGTLSLLEQEFVQASRENAAHEAARALQLLHARKVQRILTGVSGGAILALALFVLFSSGIIYGLRPPARMEGIYNIAVANIGLLDAHGEVRRGDGEAGLRLSEWIANSLKAELEDSPDIWIWNDSSQLRRQNVHIGWVDPSSSQNGRESAEDLADRLGADLLVFGYIDTRSSPNTLTLEFWLTKKTSVRFEEVQGAHRFTTPITILDPAKPGLEVQAELRRQSSTLAWIAMGLFHAQLGQTEEALLNFERAAKFSPRSEVVRFFLGREYLFLAERSPEQRDELERQAEQAFQSSVELNSAYARSYIGLGSVYFTQAQRQVLALNADLQAGVQSTALQETLTKIDSASAAYQSAIDLQPKVEDYGVPVDVIARLGVGKSHRVKGEILYYAGDFQASAQLFEQAVAHLEESIQPFEAGGLDRYLAQTFEGLGNAYYWRAVLYETQEQYTESQSAYQKALQYYDACILRGTTSPDEFIRRDIMANRCVPFREEVLERIGLDEGGQG